MSNVALLDMLANGTNPPKIMPYLGDCYDSLANLTFITLEDGTTSSKTVNEMVSIWALCSRRHLVAVYRPTFAFSRLCFILEHARTLSSMLTRTLTLRGQHEHAIVCSNSRTWPEHRHNVYMLTWHCHVSAANKISRLAFLRLQKTANTSKLSKISPWKARSRGT